MNKYQKTLKRIRNDYLNNQNKDCDVLEELVERATPKKPNNKKINYYLETYEVNSINGDCPCCGKTVSVDDYYKANYCPTCGQAIDWGVEE